MDEIKTFIRRPSGSGVCGTKLAFGTGGGNIALRKMLADGWGAKLIRLQKSTIN